MPFFSIIVPVYNVAPYLRECLDSVLAQTYPDWECLCVDDGSTDESGAILDEYAAKDARFRIVHKKNGGVSSARNVALDYTRGEYVCFLDGDDLVDANLFTTLRICLEKKHDMVRYNFQTFNNKVQIDTCVYGHRDREEEVFVIRKAKECRRAFKMLLSDSACCVCFKNEIIKKNKLGFEKFSHGEDTLFVMIFFGYIQIGAYLNKNLYFYRNRPGSAMRCIGLKLNALTANLLVAKRKFEITRRWKNLNVLKSLIYKRINVTLSGVTYRMVQMLPLEEKREGQKIYTSMLNYLYHQKGFHPNWLIQKCYCAMGFFSWRLVAYCCLRMPLVIKGWIWKILHR